MPPFKTSHLLCAVLSPLALAACTSGSGIEYQALEDELAAKGSLTFSKTTHALYKQQTPSGVLGEDQFFFTLLDDSEYELSVTRKEDGTPLVIFTYDGATAEYSEDMSPGFKETNVEGIKSEFSAAGDYFFAPPQ